MTPFDAGGGPLQLRIAILGNPCVYPEWDELQVGALRDAGFNAVQLNIAWGRRPKDEALNLRDVVSLPGAEEDRRVAARRADLQHREALARAFGLRTLFHFGSPFMYRNPYTGEVNRDWTAIRDDPWYDVLNPLVVEYETGLLREFRRQFPEVQDILVYTYDQDAWQVSEFAESRYSRGRPLHERLPGYLRALHEVWTEGREESSVMWWEPWELSAGQIYKILPQLPRDGFGLMLHSNLAEVQISMPFDVWFRNTARICRDLGIPVVGEGFFCSMTEEVEPLTIPCPRLVDEEFLSITGVSGVVGIKEYYGVLPLARDPNLDMLRARLSHPAAFTEELLEHITARYGPLQQKMLHLLGLLADAMQLFPWDSTWMIRNLGIADPDHGWAGATVRGQMVETPAWRSTRYAHFMKTDDRQPHAFMLEDIGLRCEVTAEALAEALATLHELLPRLQDVEDRQAFGQIERDAETFRQVAMSYALHLRETNVAELLRGDLAAARPMTPRLLEEMGRLLEADANNQGREGRVMDMLKLFRAAPEEFVRRHLVPTEKTPLEKGHHTMTTR